MSKIEKRLAEEHDRLNNITAPAELEGRLRHALDKVPVTRKVKPKWPLAVAALLFLCLIGYNYNGLAYYGKKIMGFDDLMSGTLAELNEEGMGQTIGKGVLLEDGTELTVDGIMTDANQLILYYTLTNFDEMEDIIFKGITGFLTKSHMGGGTSIINEEQSEIKGQMIFDPVSPFAKKLTLEFTKLTVDGKSLSGSIAFPYDPNKAMQTEIRQRINKSVKVDTGTIKFKTITATPTVTIIKGKVNVRNLSRVQIPFDKVELLANGEPVEMIGSGLKSSLGGKKFELRFDALPKKLDSLEFVVKEFVGYTIIDKKIPLTSIKEQPYLIKGEDVWVRDVVNTVDGVEVTIASDGDVLFDGVTIGGEEGSYPLQTTVRQNYEEFEDGKMLKVRTLVFSSETTPNYLQIKGMHHIKPVDYKIDIPVR
ncbi:DUF4179 domain-containing protein [Sporosarcina sp. UB5]|uniref:DUF4179 domain-containing protein n=1 Tax=Sporosarcina sp. UB5 TaxID=3047463 RepID=UPI003D7BACE9